MTTENENAKATPAAPADDLAAARAQAEQNWDKFLRAAADLENYRKRVAREKEELARFTVERVINTLLPALDNLERALEHSEAGTPLHDGLLQVQKQFERALADFGLTEVTAKPGDPFDANLHEAVSRVESDLPENSIVEQLHSAYKLSDRLLRPARVTVSAGRARSPNTPPE